MEKQKVIYPLGVQTFEKVINGGFLYIDKTDLVYSMTHEENNYIFLSRPRRFGKSLLTSTLRAYFEGRKELFRGLAIEKLEKDWTEYPVIHLSMASAKHLEKDALERYLQYILTDNAKRLRLDSIMADPNIGLLELVKAAHEKYGRQVVVLIDEYDAPLLGVAHEPQQLEIMRDVMRNFYSPLKDLDPHLRFVFITGITKFSQLSIFSELNNLRNISMLEDYASVCGITEEEMLTQMTAGIASLAEAQGLTKEEAADALKANYDGYHFTWPSPDVYNPFSLLNAFADRKLNAYWFGSGTPTFLVNMLRKFEVSPSELGTASEAVAEDFDAPTESMTSIIPLLYQSGYLPSKTATSDSTPSTYPTVRSAWD